MAREVEIVARYCALSRWSFSRRDGEGRHGVGHGRRRQAAEVSADVTRRDGGAAQQGRSSALRPVRFSIVSSSAFVNSIPARACSRCRRSPGRGWRSGTAGCGRNTRSLRPTRRLAACRSRNLSAMAGRRPRPRFRSLQQRVRSLDATPRARRRTAPR